MSSSANAFNLDQSKNLSFGKGLNTLRPKIMLSSDFSPVLRNFMNL